MIEISCDRFGVIFPLIALVIFYSSVAYDWKTAAILGLLSGFGIDLLFARDLLVSPFALLLISTLGPFWLYRGDVKDIKLQMLPGALVAFIYSFSLLFVNYYLHGYGALLFFTLIAKIIATTLLGGLLLPVIITLLDKISSKLKMELYVTAQERLLKDD